MRSGTSFFNRTVLRKNITRFAPVWVLYTVFMLMVMVVISQARGSDCIASRVCDSISFMHVIGLGYAFLCAQLLFGDLYRSCTCNALHAFSLRREGWFLTNVVSGLLFYLVPNLLIGVLYTLLLGKLRIIGLLWFCATALPYLFFFGAAVLSAYCVGNRFGLLLVYGILNFIFPLCYWLLSGLYFPLLKGVTFPDELFYEVLCPVAKFTVGRFVSVYEEQQLIFSEGMWLYAGICAVIGIGMLVLGLLAYRKRQLERAGDLITVRLLKPVFLILYTLCASAVCHGFFSLFFGDETLLFPLIGLTVGFFTGKMLLERTVRVFRLKNIGFYLAVALIFLGSLLITKLDPAGIVRWIPSQDEVACVDIDTLGNTRSPAVKGLSTPEAISDMLHVHERCLQDVDDGSVFTFPVYLRYTLKNGSVHTRLYQIHEPLAVGQNGIREILRPYLSTPEVLFDMESPTKESISEDAEMVEVDGFSVEPEDIPSLIDAVFADAEDGTLVQDWSFHPQDIVRSVSLFLRSRDRFTTITVFSDSVHLSEWFSEHPQYDFDQFDPEKAY